MCRILIWIFTILYVLAVASLLIGTFGLFGGEQDPLSGIFLLPLGMPWNLLVDLAPEPTWAGLITLTPAINLALLWAFCRYLKNRRKA